MDDLDPTELTHNQEAQDRLRLTTWCREQLGATVVRIERQSRWRPAWYVDAELNGQIRSYYARGDRGSMFFLPWRLDREMSVLKVLHENGIPVPRVFGMCEEPKAIIMEAIEGSRDLTGLTEEQARNVMDQYVDILKKVHDIDVQCFARVGVRVPQTPAETALVLFSETEKGFDETVKIGPDAFVAFVRSWVHRNLPLNRTRLSFVTGDPGQFLVRDGRIVSLIDFEVSYVGDPMADLGALRIRNLEEPFGNAEYVLRRYAELTGERLDTKVLNFYQVILSSVTNLMEHRLLHEPKRDLIYWRASEVKAARLAINAMADIMEISLSKITPPNPARTYHDVAFEALVNVISALPAPSPLDQYNHKNAVALAEHLRDVNRFGLIMDEEELDDVANLIGYRPPSIADAEEPLEHHILKAKPRGDESLLRFFDRRFQRRRLTLDAHDPRLKLYDLPPLSKIL
jgi:aminoglycoside phosphotransferase (APT) family kinase protein